MKISEEKFNKLCQLDRIEYRQKEDRIKKRYRVALVPHVVLLILVVFAYLLLMAAVGNNSLGIEFSQNILRCSREFLFYSVFIIIFAFIVDAILDAVESKELKKLNEEFFKVEIKKR